MAGYNRTRYVEQLLEKTESSPPSFTVHLYPEYWVLNNGSKFLYHNQIASLLDDIRAHRIPVDFLHLFDQARVPFYEGCMVVELLDYRPQKSKEPALKTPEKTRVILHPNAETLYEDICSLNAQHGSKWTDQDALDIEAKLLLVTSQPLCLDPDPHLTRIVNHVIRVSTPSMPMSLKRKASVMEPEEDGPEKAKRDRLMGFMAPRGLKPHPDYKLLDSMHKARTVKAAEASAQPSNSQFSLPNQSGTPSQPIPLPPPQATPAPPTPAPAISSAPSPAESVDKKGSKIKKETPQMPFNVAFTRSNGSQTPVPVPPQPTQHQFVNQNPPQAPSSNPMMQPQTYPSVQAAQAASRQPTTAAQQHYLQQYQIHQFQAQQAQAQAQQTQQQAQQSQQSPTPTTQPQPRPPSQPINPTPPAIAPANHASVPPGRISQSPKPSMQPIQPSPTPQPGAQPYAATPTFQAATPHQNFLQQPPMRRPPTAMGTPAQTHTQLPMSPNMNSQGQIQAYSPQMQQSQQQQLQAHQQQQHQQQQMIQQRINLANMQKNGRMTPQVSQQQQVGASGGGVMQTPTMGAATVTPSPVRNSPIPVNQQQATAVNRGSPMAAKAQIPLQNGGQQTQQQAQPGQVQQQTQLTPQQQQQQHLAQQAMAQRMFPAQYPSNLRPHPGQAQVIAQATSGGTPATMAASSPMMNARPITPAVTLGPDGKPIPAIGRRTPMPSTQQQQQQQQLMQASNAAGSPRSQTPSVMQQHSSPAQAHAMLHQQQQQLAAMQRAQAAPTPQPAMTPRQQAAQLQQVHVQAVQATQAQMQQNQQHQLQAQQQQQQQQAQAHAQQQLQAQAQAQQAQNQAGQQQQGGQQGQGQGQGGLVAPGQFAGLYSSYTPFQMTGTAAGAAYWQMNRGMMTPAQQTQLQQHLQQTQLQAAAGQQAQGQGQGQGQGQSQQQPQQQQNPTALTQQQIAQLPIDQRIQMIRAQHAHYSNILNTMASTVGGHQQVGNLAPTQQQQYQFLAQKRDQLGTQLVMLTQAQGGGVQQHQKLQQQLQQVQTQAQGQVHAGGVINNVNGNVNVGMGNAQMGMGMGMGMGGIAGHTGLQGSQVQMAQMQLLNKIQQTGQIPPGVTKEQVAMLMARNQQQQQERVRVAQAQAQAQAQAIQQQQQQQAIQKAMAMKGAAGKKPGGQR